MSLTPLQRNTICFPCNKLDSLHCCSVTEFLIFAFQTVIIRVSFFLFPSLILLSVMHNATCVKCKLQRISLDYLMYIADTLFMKTNTDIINSWPDIKTLAADLDENPITVRCWKQRDSIPCSKWHKIVEVSRRRKLGVTLKLLAKLAAD